MSKYIVEFLGPKGWEITHEGDSFKKACEVARACTKEGYEARVVMLP